MAAGSAVPRSSPLDGRWHSVVVVGLPILGRGLLRRSLAVMASDLHKANRVPVNALSAALVRGQVRSGLGNTSCVPRPWSFRCHSEVV